MRLTQISPNDHVTESVQERSIKTYLSESLYNTPEMQSHWKRIDEDFVKGYETYLSEVALTPDQIQGIFTQASASGAGAAPKEPGKLAAIFDKVLPSSQAANLEKSLPEPNAGPVDGFENKAAAAVNGLQGVDGGTKQSLMQLVKAGIKKPETQQLILAAVGAGLGGLISKVGPFLSMIPGGGPIVAAVTGAVVAGGVAVLAAKLRGEDWKSAFKGAIKPALMGGAAAVVGNLVTTGISAMMSGSTPAAPESGEFSADPALKKLNAQQQDTLSKLDPDKFTVQQGSNGLQIIDKATGELSGTIQAPPGVRPGDLYAALEKVNPGFAPGAPTAYSGQGAVGGQAAADIPGGGQITDPNGPNYNSDYAEIVRDTPELVQNKQHIADLDSKFSGPSSTGKIDAFMADKPATATVRGEIPAGATATDNAGSYVLNKTNPDGSSSQTIRSNGDPADPRVRAEIDARQAYYKNDPRGQAEYAKIMGSGRKGIDDGKLPTGKKLSEGQVYLVINRICRHKLNEGPLDAIKGLFGKSKAAAPATAVTADALNAAWKQAGSPTDSDEIAAILKQAGVGDDVVGKVYTDLKIPAPGTKPAAAAIDIEQVKKIIAALPVDRKVRLLKFMQKNTATAPAQG